MRYVRRRILCVKRDNWKPSYVIEKHLPFSNVEQHSFIVTVFVECRSGHQHHLLVWSRTTLLLQSTWLENRSLCHLLQVLRNLCKPSNKINDLWRSWIQVAHWFFGGYWTAFFCGDTPVINVFGYVLPGNQLVVLLWTM